MGTKKNFVLDTNVILHDYNCLKNFQENDIYLPIVVIEELDKFKKGNEQINYNAREFVRERVKSILRLYVILFLHVSPIIRFWP